MSQKETEKQSNPEDARRKIVDFAFNSDDVPKIYTNGFINILNNSDITVILQRNGKPVGVVNMSYTLGKTLHRKLGNMIKEFEAESGHEIMTTDLVNKVLTKKS